MDTTKTTTGGPTAPSSQCVLDVLAPLNNKKWSDDTRETVLKKLLENPSLVAAIDTPEGEEDCVTAVLARLPTSYVRPDVCAMLHELLNYTTEQRVPLLEAALACVKEAEEQAWAAKDKAVKATRTAKLLTHAIRAMSPRERALLKVISIIDTMDGPEGVDVCNLWRELVWPAPIKCLREDPSCEELMLLYDVTRLLPK